jgi:vacuolar iron transporter family protein
LILPYLLLQNEILSLAISLTTSVVIIAIFNFYAYPSPMISPLARRFLEMAGLSLGVASFSFLVGTADPQLVRD